MNENCEECKGTGWVLQTTMQDTTHPGYEVFKALLYVECKCKEKQAA